MADYEHEWNGTEPPENHYPQQLCQDLRRIEREICGDGLRQRVLGWTGDLGDGQSRATAYGAIGALRAVMSGPTLGSVRAAHEDLQGSHCLLGVTLAAVPDGGQVLVQRQGEIQDSSWSWTPGQWVFAAIDGTLAPAPQGTWVRYVGMAAAPDRLLVRIAPPLRRG